MNITDKHEIAIVGYGFRMPGGIKSEEDFWELLESRKIVQVPVETRYGKGYLSVVGKSTPGRFASAFEGLILDDEELQFDCKLFGISTQEASHMDPQIKMLLTCTWEAFEKSGWTLHQLRNSNTGVFVGTQISSSANWRAPLGVTEFTVPGSSLSMFANRISYHFNLMGPSISTLTACSSGISALHAAVNAIRCGDCKQAVVGASNYLGSFVGSAGFNALGVISPDGKCNSFDASANGYMRSEGVFVYIVKPLEDAERDGDPIHAVIVDTYTNTAGTADDSSDLIQGRYITAPTIHAQVDLFQSVTKRSGIPPERFDYIEAHATGTKLGDKIEGNSIGRVFGGFDREAPIRVGSVKSNLGHMEAASFHLGLLKAVIMMKRRTFAPISQNYIIPNPEIDFVGLNMRVQIECEAFPEHQVVMGVNSFGFGGANGICVLKEYQPSEPVIYSKPFVPETSYMFPLTARTSDVLIKCAEQLRLAIEKERFDLYTLAGNLSTRRTLYGTRTYFVARSENELVKAIKNFEDEPKNHSTVTRGEPRILMVFSGQGVQWAGCGKELYIANPVFRRTLDAIECYWRQYSDTSLLDACFHADQKDLDECQSAQPVIFMIQCGLVELLKTCGIYADAVVGHSAGEVAASYASGALTLAEATRLVYYRATLQQRTAGSGRMLAIGLDRGGVESLLTEAGLTYGSEDGLGVEIACENAPASVVVCGKEEILQPLIQLMESRNIQHKLLRGNIAFHSGAMNVIKEEIFSSLAFLDECAFDQTTPMISSVTGKVVQRLDSSYWWTNVRKPVMFKAAIQEAAIICRPDVILEVSPHNALDALVEQCFEKEKIKPPCLATLKRNTDDCDSFNEVLGQLFQQGVALDFYIQYPRPKPITHLLPPYPREEQRMIDDLIDDVHFLKRGHYSHGPMVGHQSTFGDLNFEVRLSERDFPWLAHHCVQNMAIVPAAGYMEIILEALEGGPIHIINLEFLSPCEIGKHPVRLQTKLNPVPGTQNEFSFEISSKSFGKETLSTLHCKGAVRKVDKDFKTKAKSLADIDLTAFSPTQFKNPGEYYKQIDALLGDNFQYGPYFQVVQNIYCNPVTKELLLHLHMNEALFFDCKRDGIVLHPSLMDGALQSYIYYILQATDISGIPRAAKALTIFKSPTSPKLLCYYCPPAATTNLQEKGQITFALGEQPCGSISLYDENTGLLIAHLDQYFSFHSNSNRADLAHSKKVVRWQPKFVEDLSSQFEQFSKEEPNPARLIEALEYRNSPQPYSIRVIEFTYNTNPEQAMLKHCLEYLQSERSQTEYWLVCGDGENMQKHYEAYNHYDTALRFDYVDLAEVKPFDLTTGLLRSAAAELLIIHIKDEENNADQWQKLQNLLVPGGLVLVYHEENILVNPLPGWIELKAYKAATLFQLGTVGIGSEAEELPSESATKYCIVGEAEIQSDSWRKLIGHDNFITWDEFILEDCNIYKLLAPEKVVAIDIFCNSSAADPTGLEWVKQFTFFLQRLMVKRNGYKAKSCQIRIITHKAVFEVDNPSGSAVWGAVRCMMMELHSHSNFSINLIDIAESSDLETLVGLKLFQTREQELAIRKQKVWVPRVINIKNEFPTVKAGSNHAYRLMVENPGQVTGLKFKTYTIPTLGPDQVVIEVKAAALNFRDVMVVLERLPLLSYERSALGHEVGMEASGIVKHVGSTVSRWKEGDEVVFMRGGCIANRVVTNDSAIFKKPKNLSMAEAAGVMSVYVTAYYALLHLSRLRKGQRVLIHSALGGVGLAAIALAKHVGAEIYVTAGSIDKRKTLLKLGAKAAFDSRSFSWYDDLITETDGEGVDVVLNSLAGHHIKLCLEALRPGGWHCEIGKVDIYADNTLNLCVFRKNLRFLAIDVDRLMNDDPELSIEISQKCLDLIETGALPPLPIKTFDYSQYQDAFRVLMNGLHTGKLILEASDSDDVSNLHIADTQPFLDASGTYLITGGMGGLGLRLLPYLSYAGAKHITLMDRAQETRRTVEWVRQHSQMDCLYPEVDIEIIQGDVALEVDVIRCIGQLQNPLKGVFHLAGVLEDQMIMNLNSESFDKVFAPKAMGAFYLHQATKDITLDHFVVLSSIASIFGSPGQINYGAANAYLDGLIAYRKGLGLPGLSFNMGAVAEVGMASRDTHVLRMLKSSGMPAISVVFAISGLDYALRQKTNESHLITALFKRIPLSLDHPDYMRFGRLMSNRDCLKVGSGERLTPGGISVKIAKKVAELCGHGEVDQIEPIASFGLNSISVSELAAFINTQFNYQVSVIDLMTKASARSLAIAIIDKQHDAGIQKETEIPERTEQQETQSIAVNLWKEKIPSIFATTNKDHFPGNNDKVKTNSIVPKSTDSTTASNGKLRKAACSSFFLPKLEESLPIECQMDLTEIQSYIRKILRIRMPEKAVNASHIRRVFLTGATGFIGRFILKDLLVQNPEIQIYCLVRADTPQHGLERIKHALQLAEIWQDEFANRIQVLTGDICQHGFGFNDAIFEQLKHEVDAVYHLAADLTLAAPYSTISKVNTDSIRNVLDLVLGMRFKHLFYASTMGIFPQYFAHFSNEFKEIAIGTQDQPDLNIMKSLLPPGFIGYPWSKLVVEQSLLFAKSAGMPLGIFRFPQTCLSAESGFTHSGDLKVRIAMSILSTGIIPYSFKNNWTEPVDTISKICTAISFNPARKYTIYHCVNPNPATHEIDYKDIGIELKEGTYETFKDACLKEGTNSSLDGHWTLLDYFAAYWFSDNRKTHALPISDAAIRQDCPQGIEWPGSITSTVNSFMWIIRNKNKWPFVIPQSSINFDLLNARAHKHADGFGLSFEEAYTSAGIEGLNQLVKNLNTPAARILEERKASIALTLSSQLYNLAALACERKYHPEISLEEIKHPVFILGINRTGTTFLHRLLSRDDQFWTLKPYEIYRPVINEGNYKEIGGKIDDPRRVYTNDLISAYKAVEGLAGIHHIDVDEPEEEFALLESSFAAWSLASHYNMPDYKSWLAHNGSARAYKVHQQMMQHYNWQRKQLGHGPKQWLLKMPYHLKELATLLETYPDAIIIQTHRDPCEIMGSWNHLIEQAQGQLATLPDKHYIGLDQLDFMSTMLNEAMAFRAANPRLESNWIDISYYELINNPMAMVEHICASIGGEITEYARLNMQNYIQKQSESRTNEVRHSYRLEEYGLTAIQVRDSFKPYLEFAKSRGIKVDPEVALA